MAGLALASSEPFYKTSQRQENLAYIPHYYNVVQSSFQTSASWQHHSSAQSRHGAAHPLSVNEEGTRAT